MSNNTPGDPHRGIDPELLPLLAAFSTLTLTRETLATARATIAEGAPAPAADAPGTTEHHTAPGPAGAPDVPLLLHRPPNSAAPLPAILHMHGGGYVLGTPAADAPGHRQLAADLNCCIASVDYRLAPETPFPGGIEDCYAALTWLAAHATALGIDPARIGVMGESAGGGLAAALALLARDRGGPALAFQHLIYPMLDDRTGLAGDPPPPVGQVVWTAAHNRFGWGALLGPQHGAPDVSPYAAAARAQNLAGLPPAFIATGALDLFVAEDLAYAHRLIAAGVAVELHVYPGAFHGFDYAPEAAVAAQARRDSRAALARALGAARPAL